MKKYVRYEEKNKKDLNELVGEFKGKYGSFKDVKKDKEFIKLSFADKEYILDELKAEGTFKESALPGKNSSVKLKQLVLKALRKFNKKSSYNEVYNILLDSIEDGTLEWNTDQDIFDYVEYYLFQDD